MIQAQSPPKWVFTNSLSYLILCYPGKRPTLPAVAVHHTEMEEAELDPFFLPHISSEKKWNVGEVVCPVPMDEEDNLSSYCTLSNYYS